MKKHRLLSNYVLKYIMENKDKFMEVFWMADYLACSKDDLERHPHYKTYTDMANGLQKVITEHIC